MGESSSSPFSPRQALAMARGMWVMSMLTDVAVVAVFAAAKWLLDLPARPAWVWPALAIGCVVLVICTIAGYVIQMQVYKRFWVGHCVTAPGYLGGLFALYSCHQVTLLVSLVAVVVCGVWWPLVLPGAAASLLMLIAYPTGKPLRQTPAAECGGARRGHRG